MEHNQIRYLPRRFTERCLERATLSGAMRMNAPSTAFTMLSSPKAASRRRSIWRLTSLQAGSKL